jgi:hypothetical protein
VGGRDGGRLTGVGERLWTSRVDWTSLLSAGTGRVEREEEEEEGVTEVVEEEGEEGVGGPAAEGMDWREGGREGGREGRMEGGREAVRGEGQG